MTTMTTTTSSKVMKIWSIPEKEEWLLDSSRTQQLAVDLAAWIPKSSRDRKLEVLVPGVGYSSVGLKLTQASNWSITLTDVDEKAVEFQKNKFQESAVTPTRIIVDDALNSKLTNVKFDIILDSSVSDVFIRAKKGSCFIAALERMLAPGGVMLSISMFHKPWKRLCSKQYWSSLYGHVPHFIRSRRQIASNSGGIPRPIAVFVHRRRSDLSADENTNDLELARISFKRLSEVKTENMQKGAEDF